MTAFVRTHVPRAVVIAVVTLLSAALLLGTADPASGYTVRKTIKKPGRVTLYQVQGSHHPNECPIVPCWNPWIVQRGAVVGRSPAARGRQAVSIRYELQRWYNDRWNLQAQQTFHKHIPRGRKRVRMPRFDVVPTAANYLRVRVAIAWGKGSRTLGGRLYVFNQQSDYVCATQFTNVCRTGPGWVWLRAPGA